MRLVALRSAVPAGGTGLGGVNIAPVLPHVTFRCIGPRLAGTEITHAQDTRRAAAHGRRHVQQLGRRRNDGEIPVEIGLKPIRSEGRDFVLAVMVDIRERKRIEERQRLLIGELNHRIQNLFAVIHSVALHSLSGNRSLVDAREVFIDRLQSLGRAYTMMSGQEWRGAPLRQILAAETSAFVDRVSVDGIDLMVRQKAAQSFALILHDLTTNAVKYGALSVPAGRVNVSWSVDRESSGVPEGLIRPCDLLQL